MKINIKETRNIPVREVKTIVFKEVKRINLIGGDINVERIRNV